MLTRYRQSQPECSICFQKINMRGKLEVCDHPFCTQCIERWSQTENTCPLCKRKFKNITHLPTRKTYYSKRSKKILQDKQIEQKSQCSTNPFVEIYVNSLSAHEFLDINHDLNFLNFILAFQRELANS